LLNQVEGGWRKMVEEVNSWMIYLKHFKNLRKCHNVPPPITTIRKNDLKKIKAIQELEQFQLTKMILNISCHKGSIYIKTRLWFLLTLHRMATNKNTNNKFWWGYGGKWTVTHFFWDCKLLQLLWKIL
jgi:hypothetical protein